MAPATTEPPEFWFDASALTRQRRGRRGKAIGSFAKANDLVYVSWIDPGERDMPSLLLRNTRTDVISYPSPPAVEFGNHGWRYWLGSDDFVPSRQGYIAVRHDLRLPRLLISCSTFGALTPLHVGSAAITALGMLTFAEQSAGPDHSAFHRFRDRGSLVELPPDIGFRAHCEKGHEEQARILLDGEAARLLADLSQSFSVEANENWLFAYSHYGDITTRDAEVWAWAFAAMSRLRDLARVWGADLPPIPFATERHIARPRQLDGALGRLKRRPT
ncbi:MAG: hypothetical protein QM621_09610 [Aeromicrobium sp.]|uniref:hypothetical protein n=1 Tax=Aeromicrobium sp. TaxID=1871063 RepID=UPI0039E659CE